MKNSSNNKNRYDSKELYSPYNQYNKEIQEESNRIIYTFFKQSRGEYNNETIHIKSNIINNI